MSDSADYEDFIQMLKEQGHDDAEVQKILERVRQHDLETKHDSVMDSIAKGHFNLSQIISEALEEE